MRFFLLKLKHYGLKVHRLFYERLKVVLVKLQCVATRAFENYNATALH
ncbi:MAG: hypothetical protein RIR39_2169 [Pseudomonadota bacterium]|jgi:hypothetical protein